MALAVRELLEVPGLGLVVRAGDAGLGREVYRAQVSELPDPWAWLDPGTLVMTTGIGIPSEPQDQRRYVEMLDDHGLSGLLVGEHPGERINAPDLSDDFVRAAMDRSFPVLTMPYEMPFSGVAEVVSRAASESEHRSLLRALRIYDAVRRAIPASGGDLLPRLAEVVECDLYLLAPATGRPMGLGTPRPGNERFPSQESLEILRDYCDEEGRLARSTVRLKSDGGSAVALPVPSTRSVALVALSRGEREPDLSALRHSAAAIAIEVEREAAERERRYRLGTGLLSELVEGRIEEVAASRTLSDLGLSTDTLVIAAVSATGSREEEKLVLQLEGLGIEPLVRRYADDVVVLLDGDLARGSLAKEIDGPVGLSAPLGRLSRISDAVREALWALWQARECGSSFAEYGSSKASPFLPRTIDESQAVVRSVLGPLLDYDSENETKLIPTLRSYLASGKSLKLTASEMRIHRQTVVYRVKRVEDLTDLRMGKMDDVANLWFALKSLETLDRLGARDK